MGDGGSSVGRGDSAARRNRKVERWWQRKRNIS
jgi:hypothetical protein